jgi:protein TonB
MAAKNKPYEQFGPYILFKKLESDALGDLWRAARIEGNTLGTTVALRRLIGGNREAMLASIDIARQVAPLLTGPSFARDQVIDEVGGVPFIAHDYAGGRSLRHVVDRARGGAGIPPNPIPMDQAIVIAEKVALSLETIAELRFAGERLSHGALIPQFIWISDDGEIRVAGQQLGKGMIGAKAPHEIARYFSPEYQHSGLPTKASEVYSLGAILFLAVTGHEPPDAMSTSAFAAAIRGAKTMTGAPVPDDIKPILDKSLNLDPAMRYASVADMKQALSSLTNSGKYSATTFNLAFYLTSLLKKEFESESIEREKETKINVAPYIDALAEPAPPITPVASVAAAVSASSAPRRSKMPMAIAAAVAIALIGGAGAFVAFGSKKTAPAEPVKRLASAVPAPPPVRQPVIPEPILSSPAQQTGTISTMDAATAQKKAFEDAVKQKLHAEMMKLQSDYTKQLQQQQSKNAPVPAATAPVQVAQAQPQRQQEEHAPELSAAQLDQRQRDTTRQQDAAIPVPAVTTQAPAPVPEPEPAVAAPQIREGDVVDVSALDTVPKRTRDPHVTYPPMAARQRIETSVLMSVLISETGDVLDVKVLRGDDRFGFTDSAVRALRTAKYSPAMKDGKHVKTWLPQMIQFKPGT